MFTTIFKLFSFTVFQSTVLGDFDQLLKKTDKYNFIVQYCWVCVPNIHYSKDLNQLHFKKQK